MKLLILPCIIRVFPGKAQYFAESDLVLMLQPSILHVEDEDSSAFLLQAALEQAAIPYRTFRVSTGEDALAFLCKTGSYQEAESPGLVLLDLTLSRVDGWTVLSTMKSRRDLQKIPVVILSSSEHEADKTRAMELGAEQYVQKLNTVAEMRRAILDVCAGLMSFQVSLDAARRYTLTTATIAFERTVDSGVEINIASVLPEGAVVKLIATDMRSSSAQVRYGSQEVWMSLYDLRDHAVLTRTTHPDFPAAPYLSQA